MGSISLRFTGCITRTLAFAFHGCGMWFAVQMDFEFHPLFKEGKRNDDNNDEQKKLWLVKSSNGT